MSGKKALVHIGTYKTGSTAIQSALSAATVTAGLQDITYPLLDPIFRNSQHYLDLFYKDEGRQFPDFKYSVEKLGIDVSALYRKYIALLGSADKVILSSELMTSFDEASVNRLKHDLLESGYTDFQLVVYVREPVSYFQSLLQEYIKASRYCYQPSWHNGLSQIRAVIELFSEVFGGNVCVREFNRSNLSGNDVVIDFASLASAFFGASVKLKPVVANESLSAEAVFILHEYRSGLPFTNADEQIFFPEVADLIRQLSEVRLSGEKISIRQEISDFIVAQNIRDADWFQKKYDIDFFSSMNTIAPSRLEEPLKLEEIIVKPNQLSIDRVREHIKFPRPKPSPPRPDHEARLTDFVRKKTDGCKVLYGGGALFSVLIAKLWMSKTEVDFSGLIFVDRMPGLRRCRDWLFSFVGPDEVDWASVDTVLICTPAYESEVRAYLREKNSLLSISSIAVQHKLESF